MYRAWGYGVQGMAWGMGGERVLSVCSMLHAAHARLAVLLYWLAGRALHPPPYLYSYTLYTHSGDSEATRNSLSSASVLLHYANTPCARRASA
jgi:hypothetical protein